MDRTRRRQQSILAAAAESRRKRPAPAPSAAAADRTTRAAPSAPPLTPQAVDLIVAMASLTGRLRMAGVCRQWRDAVRRHDAGADDLCRRLVRRPHAYQARAVAEMARREARATSRGVGFNHALIADVGAGKTATMLVAAIAGGGRTLWVTTASLVTEVLGEAAALWGAAAANDAVLLYHTGMGGAATAKQLDAMPPERIRSARIIVVTDNELQRMKHGADLMAHYGVGGDEERTATVRGGRSVPPYLFTTNPREARDMVRYKRRADTLLRSASYRRVVFDELPHTCGGEGTRQQRSPANRIAATWIDAPFWYGLTATVTTPVVRRWLVANDRPPWHVVDARLSDAVECRRLTLDVRDRLWARYVVAMQAPPSAPHTAPTIAVRAHLVTVPLNDDMRRWLVTNGGASAATANAVRAAMANGDGADADRLLRAASLTSTTHDQFYAYRDFAKHFSLATATATHPKVQALIALLRDRIPRDECVLVLGAAYHTEPDATRQLKRALDAALGVRCRMFCGWQPAATRSRHKREFMESHDARDRVLLCDARVAALGNNLWRASHVVFMSPIADATNAYQMIGRVRRQGQARDTVHVWRMAYAGIRYEEQTYERAGIDVGGGDDDDDAPPVAKRKTPLRRCKRPTSGKAEVLDLTGDDADEAAPPRRKRARANS